MHIILHSMILFYIFMVYENEKVSIDCVDVYLENKTSIERLGYKKVVYRTDQEPAIGIDGRTGQANPRSDGPGGIEGVRFVE